MLESRCLPGQQTRGFSFGRGQRVTRNLSAWLRAKPLVQRVSALRDPGRHVDRSLGKGLCAMETLAGNADLKFCRKCQSWKVPAAFYKDMSKPDNLATVCRECKLEYEAQRRADRKRRRDGKYTPLILKPELAAYLAGCIDCDGSIQVHRDTGPIRKADGVRPTYYVATVSFTQVDMQIHDLLTSSCGGKVYRYVRENGGRGYWNTWHVSHRAAQVFLLAILPYLKLKRKQAEACLRLIELIERQNAERPRNEPLTLAQLAERKSICDEVRAYNVRNGPK